jgi:hypothetical protein
MKLTLQLVALIALTATFAVVPNTGSDRSIVNLTNCKLTPVSSHHRAAPRIRNRNGTSSNWGGYAVQTSLTAPQKYAVSAVQGSWQIPTVTASGSSQTYSAFWVGIDGYSDNTVEQLGTEQDWTPSGAQYSVWFEMYPHVSYNVTGFPIAPGDTFSASVKYAGNGMFTLTITNLSQHVAYTVPTRYTKMTSAQRESAEWIAEAPWSGGTLPLADFGTSPFANCTATVNGVTGPIDSSRWKYDAITMASGSVTKAVPSALKDSPSGSAFSMQWFHE